MFGDLALSLCLPSQGREAMFQRPVIFRYFKCQNTKKIVLMSEWV